MTSLSQYRIQFVRTDTFHWPSGDSFTGPICHNRYYRTKKGVLKRLVSLLQDPLVRQIEVTKGDRSRLQPFYCAFYKTRLYSKATIEDNTRWYVPSWGWGSWKALSALLEVEKTFWHKFAWEDSDTLGSEDE
jgi:hypothetical protein